MQSFILSNLTRLAVVLLFSLMLSVYASAQESWLTSKQHEHIAVRLTPVAIDETAQTAKVILEVKLEDGWKTYWRSPGEGGIAPSIELDQSSNVEQLNWQWPAPQRFKVSGVNTVGYQGNIAFPLELQLTPGTADARLKGILTMSSCTDICVLTDFELDLPLAPAQDSAERLEHRYQQALSSVPIEAHSYLTVDALNYDPEAQQLQLRINRLQGSWQQPRIFIDASNASSPELKDLTYSEPTLNVDKHALTATMKVSHWLEMPELVGESLQVTVVDDDVAAEYSSVVTHDQIIVSSGAATPSLALTMAIALLGGLILNIMPCVLPVLGMKLQSILALSQSQKSLVRKQFLASAAGIIVSFGLLAGFVLTLQTMGTAVGWGTQFQHPVFIGLMIIVTWLFSLNLAGLFEFRLPTQANDWLLRTSEARPQTDEHGKNGLSKHFLQGMFATLLATPCSAPFLGTAVSVAFIAPPLHLIAIFIALGVGMAIPWLLIAAWPKCAQYLPRPGRWMVVLKYVFAGMMALTTLWLISLLTSFWQTQTVLLVATLIVLVSLVWIGIRLGRQAVIASIACCLLIGAGFLAAGVLYQSQNPSPRSSLEWQSLFAEDIDKLVAANHVVFVDVTASWCITCQANKAGVLEREPTYSRLMAADVMRLQADWTQADERVNDFLAKHNRYGIPFNIVYGPGAPEGVELPVILSPQAVADAIELARGKS